MKLIKVRAIAPGIQGQFRREVGQVFEIEESMFSSTWMEKVTEVKPVPPVPAPAVRPTGTVANAPISKGKPSETKGSPSR